MMGRVFVSTMATKQELEDQINEKLGLDFEWSRMKKDDLVKFNDGLDDEEFIKKFVGQYANNIAGDKVQQQVEGWQPGQAIQMIAQLQKGEGSPIDFFL